MNTNNGKIPGQVISGIDNILPEILKNFKFLKHSVFLTPGIKKDELRSQFKQRRNDWQTVTGGKKFVNLVQQGYIHQLEIDVNGEKEYYGCCIDFDFLNKTTGEAIANASTIDQILELPTIKKHCWFIQPSISYTEAWHNCHAYFIFDAPISDKQQFQVVVKTLVEVIKHDLTILKGLDITNASLSKFELGVDGCTASNPSQVVFASLHPVQNIDQVLDVNFYEKMSTFFNIRATKSSRGGRKPESDVKPFQATISNEKRSPVMQASKIADSGGSSPESKTITEKVLDHLYRHLFIDKYREDPTELYGLHTPKDYQWGTRDVENSEEIIRFEGLNPFSASNNSGNSFMIIYENGLLPRGWDKSGNFERINSDGTFTNHCTYIDYFFHIFKEQYFKLIELDSNGQFPKGAFKDVVDTICKHHQIESFKWFNDDFSNMSDEQRKELLDARLSPYLRCLFGQDDSYLIYNHESGTWKQTTSYKSVNRFVILPVFKDMKEFYSALETHQKTRKYVQSFVESHDWKQVQNAEDFAEKTDKSIIPLFDGDYNTDTHQFTPFNSDVVFFNRFKHSMSDWDEKRSLENVNIFKKWLLDVYGDLVGKMMIAWIVLLCKGKGSRTKRIVSIYGKPGTGKTMYTDFIYKLLGSSFCYMFKKSDIDPSNRFGMQKITNNLFALTCDEFNRTTPEQWDILKEISGVSDKTVSVEQKNKESREVNIRFGITTSSQDEFKLPAVDDGGINRRVILIKHGTEQHRPEYIDFPEKHIQREGFVRDVFLWAIQQDTESAKMDFEAYAGSPESFQNRIDIIEFNSITFQWMKACIKFTNDPEDKVSNHRLKESFTQWASLEEIDVSSYQYKNAVHNLTKDIRRNATKENGINWRFAPEPNETIKFYEGTKQVRGLVGLKLTTPDFESHRDDF
ncbi:DNA primase [Nostoc phage N1]|nr:DNA primase [Nostoc phage N1]